MRDAAFVGRRDELRALGVLFGDGAPVRLAVINGEPGMGKTTLLDEILRLCATSWTVVRASPTSAERSAAWGAAARPRPRARQAPSSAAASRRRCRRRPARHGRPHWWGDRSYGQCTPRNLRFGKRLQREIYVASEASVTPAQNYAPIDRDASSSRSIGLFGWSHGSSPRHAFRKTRIHPASSAGQAFARKRF